MISRIRMFVSLSLVALAVRAIEFPTIVSKAGVQLPRAGDTFYHMRRIWFSVVRFPETLPFDSYVSFPSGSQILWPSAFDWTIAAMIRPFVDPTDQAAVETAKRAANRPPAAHTSGFGTSELSDPSISGANDAPSS